MAGKAVAVSSYNFTPNDRLLLDTNIWLLLYGPNKPNNNRVKVYSQAFKNMIDANCQIYIDVLIASEFINRYARIKSDFNDQIIAAPILSAHPDRTGRHHE